MNTTMLAKILNAKSKGGSVDFCGVDTDTRTLKMNNLFIALRGVNYDAHEFISQAVDLGAAAVLVDHEVDCSVPQVIVNDTHEALRYYAAWHRQQFNPTVVAITGSCGKTTTRTLVQNILIAAGFNVLATRGNWNNEIGVSLMLLQMNAQHEYVVLELGAKEMRYIRHRS